MNPESRIFRFAAAPLFAVLALCQIQPSAAAPGAAPPARESRVLSRVHTDVVAVRAGVDGLELASRADVDDEYNVPLDPALVRFNVEETTRMTVPASPAYAFLGAVGSDVWVAPYSNPDGEALWPGISTEGVPAGRVDRDEVTIGLDAVSGPGTVNLFQPIGPSEVKRLLGPGHPTWTLPVGVHDHASWSFSAPGAYTLTFSVSAAIGGEPVSVTRDYHFIVGDVPSPVETDTHLHVHGGSTVTVGTGIELHAEVSPENAAGYVEFRNGATVLGHEAVVEGEAELEIDSLPVGTHAITAHFVPLWTNDFTASVSGAETVTVTDESGVPFSIAGVAASYQPGDTLNAQVVGVSLEGGQQFRWLMRPVGTTVVGATLQTSTSTSYTRALNISDDGYEISVRLLQGTTTVLAQTPWVPVSVAQDGGAAPVLTVMSGDPGALFPGDKLRLEVTGLNLAENETVQWARRPSNGVWSTALTAAALGTKTGPDWIEVTGNLSITEYGELAVRVLRSGVPVRQSDPIFVDWKSFEVMAEGLQGLYMQGASLNLTGQIHPVRDSNADYVYKWQFSKVSDFKPSNATTVYLAEGVGTPPPLAHVLTVADHDQGYLRLVVYKPGFDGPAPGSSINYLYDHVGRSDTMRVYVTDDPNAQLFFFNALSAHYHQGESVNFALTVEPAPLAGDQITWEWKWPGADWTPFPGASGKTHPVIAEQALHGVQVRATLDFAAEGKDSIVATPVTIGVDDHGAAARQQPTISGETSVTDGDVVTLTRVLPTNGPTILTDHRWERKAAGSEDWTVIGSATGEVLTFTAALADNGAQFRVSLIKPNGDLGYGPSPAVTLEVGPGTPDGFAITGVAASYQPGDTLNAQVVGYDLAEGQQFRWLWRAIGSDVVGANVQTGANPTYTRNLSAADNGYELSVTVRQGSTVVAQTAWVPITVEQQGDRPVLTRTVSEGPLLPGDDYRMEASGLNLAEGETVRFVIRGNGSAWDQVTEAGFYLASAAFPEAHIMEGAVLTRYPFPLPDLEFAAQVVRDGLAVRQSEPIVLILQNAEVLVEGNQNLYMEGATANLSAQFYPERPGAYTYRWQFSKNANFTGAEIWHEGPEMPSTVQKVLNVADHDGGYLRVQALKEGWTDRIFGDSAIGVSAVERIYVTNDPEAQLFHFANLAAHYHQGDSVNFNLTVAPQPLAGDAILWQWKWPGEDSDWETFPDTAGASHTVTAEQALHNVQVRAILDFAAEGKDSLIAGPLIVKVDDHGAAARQQPAITGAEGHFHAGDTVTLTRILPVNGPTILTEHRWEKKAAGSEDWTVIEGATGAVLTFTAAPADNDAEYRVAIMKPNGDLGYGPSPAVTLEVEDHEGPEPGVLASAYRVELLEPTNGGVNASALGINEAGDVVGITRPTSSAQPQMTIVWERHEDHFHAEELANLAGSQFSRGFDLSEDRTVAGEAFNSGGNSIPIRWNQAGTPQHVTTLNEAGTGIFNDIDEGGTAVGTASGKAVKVAPNGTVTVLAEPDAGVAGAVVNNYTATTVAGGVAGGRASIAISGQTTLRGVVWDGDGARLLALPGGASNTGVFGISPDGTAVGAVTLASKETPILWNADGTAQVLPIPAVSTYTHGAARSVANGVAVGYVSQFAGNTSFGGAAVAWGIEGPVDLNTLTVNLPEGVTLLSASDVNSAGQIVGTARAADGTSRGFVLTPTNEEPPGPTLAISGVAEHYHTGDTVTLTAVQNPPTGEDHYHWFIKPAGAAEFTEIAGALEGVYSFTAAAEHDGAEILVRLYDHDHDLLAESAPVTIHIDDHGHEEPVLTISGVAGHYHQGNTIALTVTVEPEPHEDDRIVWEWKWPGGEWTPILGASGDTFSAIAEQALDGVQVRATLIPADEDDEPVVSAAVTIDVDDHGDPAHQVVTVAGATSYAAGDTVNLTAVVSPSTVLRAFQWQRRSAGEEEWQVVAGQTGATLGFMAMLADDGSEYRVAALRPDGSIAYGPSAAVSLAIGPMAVAEPELALSVASGDELAMTLKLPPGVSYQLEFSETLEEGSWENVGEPFTGGVEPISLTLPKTGDRGFYRLIVVEDS